MATVSEDETLFDQGKVRRRPLDLHGSVRVAITSRHSKDLVVPECKDGPTWGGRHRRIDYWVLRRSWTRPAMIAYEVKSGRQDFLTDQKWTEYLPLCNELWFIAPPGAIQPGELPEGIGLLRIAGSGPGARLITVRKAIYREVEPPATLMTYVLMCRAAITTEKDPEDPRDPGELEGWKAWLSLRAEKREIGREVSRALRERYDAEVRQVRAENERLKRDNEALDKLRAALERKGVDWNSWMTAEHVLEEISVPRWTRHELERAHEALGKLLAPEPSGR